MPKTPRRITAAYLARVTGHYLERYSTSRANLERLLLRRVYRSAAFYEVDPEPWRALVTVELDRLERIGLVDDDAYARDKARALHRRGSGLRKIRFTLQQKGLRSNVIDDALARLSEGGDPDWFAACTYARKRSLGPWRRAALDDDRRRKELGRLARAGFPFDIARRIVEAPSIEALGDAEGA